MKNEEKKVKKAKKVKKNEKLKKVSRCDYSNSDKGGSSEEDDELDRIPTTLGCHRYQRWPFRGRVKWPFRGRVNNVKKVRKVKKVKRREVKKVKKVKVQSGTFCC